MSYEVQSVLEHSRVTLSPDTFLTCPDIEVISQRETIDLELSDEATSIIQSSLAVFHETCKRGIPVYGVTTGFGPFVTYPSAEKGGHSHGSGLIAHLTAGSGEIAPEDVVKATMVIRALTLSKGHSAIPLQTLEAYLTLLRNSIIPAVPEIGSVGASGDLTPLAHIARVLVGEGYVRSGDTIVQAQDALREKETQPIPLAGRDALALVNGTAFMTAYASLAIARTIRLVHYAEGLTGWIYRILGCRAQALAEPLHHVRGHQEQLKSAAAIRKEAARYGAWENTSRPLQEVYSLRCAPQILGACRDNILYAQRIVETELNGVTDNPIVVEDTAAEAGGHVLHGGNFQGQQVAFAADALNAALTQVAVLAERQIAALLNPDINEGAPLLLAWEPGACSGMAGGQLTATSLVAEMRHHAHPCAISSIPTNGINQDVVSMGTMAARQAFYQTRRLASILSILGIACIQLNALRDHKRASGSSSPTPAWMPHVEPLMTDRGLWEETEAIARTWLNNIEFEHFSNVL